MRQEIRSRHSTDTNGNPTGGLTWGVGIEIQWQNGPLGRGPDRSEPNGAFVEGVIETARERIEFYETAAGGKFSCEENKLAINYLNLALETLDKRTRDREARQVEGTHQA